MLRHNILNNHGSVVDDLKKLLNVIENNQKMQGNYKKGNYLDA